MKTMKTRHILAAAGLLASTAISAQDLNKEITIDRDIVPAQRAAQRPVVFPGVTPPAVAPVSLRMEESGSMTRISPAITPYEPAAGEGAFPFTPYRGYVDLGYFPGIDLGLSAGYAILDKEKTKINVWLQGDNRDYKSGGESLWKDFRWKNLDIAGGFGFSQKFGSYNTLRLSTDIAFSSWSSPWEWVVDGRELYGDNLGDDTDKNLTNLRWHFAGEFSGRANDRLTYGFGAGVGILNNRKPKMTWLGEVPDYYPQPVDETSAQFNANVRHQVSGNAAVGIKAEGTFIHYSSFLTPALMAAEINDDHIENPGSKTIGQIDFVPAVEYNAGSFYGKAGARLGLSVNSGSSFHIAPDVVLGINPDAMFGAWLKFGGGVKANSLETVFQRSRYADTRLAYDLSNVALTGQFGLRVGPFKGASLTLTADYAAANDWLMPYQMTDGLRVYNLFAPAKIRSWKFGARLDWEYRSLVAVALSYECNPGDGDNHAWLYWDDRARHVLGASVSVTPVSPLTVDLGFTARLDRLQWMASPGGLEYVNDQDYIIKGPVFVSYKLGDLTNLWAGASWRFTPALTVFARFDNILGKRASLPFDVPSQGFTGLFGLGYKF